MIRLTWKYLVLGAVMMYVVAYLAELSAYKLIFIPSVESSYYIFSEDFLENQIEYGEGGLTILAAQSLRDDCTEAYYGCFDWANFVGADVVVSFQGESQSKYAIVAERNCENEKCTKLDGYDARGYFINNVEFGNVSRNFSTEITCNNVSEDYIFSYKVEFCSNITTGFSNIVSERRYAKIQGMFLSSPFRSIDYDIYFNVMANYGTRKVYRLED